MLDHGVEFVSEPRDEPYGRGVVDGPFDTAWNTRDVRATDPDGYTIAYTARRPQGERDERFTKMIRREATQQLGRAGDEQHLND